MKQAQLILVTGSPAAGKTTLSRALLQALGDERCQLICRDEFKRGVLDEADVLENQKNQRTTERFWQVVQAALAENQLVIAEAAFQHKLWTQLLSQLTAPVDVRVIVCQIELKEAIMRYEQRADKTWRELHGSEVPRSLIESYQPLKAEFPTLLVGVGQDLEEVVSFCLGNHQ